MFREAGAEEFNRTIVLFRGLEQVSELGILFVMYHDRVQEIHRARENRASAKQTKADI